MPVWPFSGRNYVTSYKVHLIFFYPLYYFFFVPNSVERGTGNEGARFSTNPRTNRTNVWVIACPTAEKEREEGRKERERGINSAVVFQVPTKCPGKKAIQLRSKTKDRDGSKNGICSPRAKGVKARSAHFFFFAMCPCSRISKRNLFSQQLSLLPLGIARRIGKYEMRHDQRNGCQHDM